MRKIIRQLPVILLLFFNGTVALEGVEISSINSDLNGKYESYENGRSVLPGRDPDPRQGQGTTGPSNISPSIINKNFLKGINRNSDMDELIRGMFHEMRRIPLGNKPIPEEKRLENVEEYLDFGVDINSKDRSLDGSTLLHIAVLKNYSLMVERFLERGANLYIKNHDDKTPLDIGRDNPANNRVLELLEAHALQNPENPNTEDADCLFSGENVSTPTLLESSVENTFLLLNEGNDNIVLSEEHMDTILVLGNTGSGKSALVQHMATNNSQLFSKKTPTGDYILIDAGDKISTTTITSKTLFPELVVDKNRSIAFYDCPGFDDTRSSSYDIAANYFIKHVVDFADNVKLVFAVSHSSVKHGVDRVDFIKLVKHATRFIKDVDKYRDAISLVVTKVSNFNDVGDFVSDDALINSIADFIKKAKQAKEDELPNQSTTIAPSTTLTPSTTPVPTALTPSTTQAPPTTTSELPQISECIEIEKSGFRNISIGKSETEKIIDFLNILLEKNSFGKYTKIGLFRRPNTCGPLNTIPLFVKGKQALDKILLQDTNYVEKVDDDFGYSISDASKNDVNDYVEYINQNITFWSRQIEYNLRPHYNNKVESSESIENLSKELSEDYFKLKIMTAELSVTNSTELFVQKIQETFKALNIKGMENFLKNILIQGTFFDFFVSVSGKELAKRVQDWVLPINNYLLILEEEKQWHQFLIDMYSRLSQWEVQFDEAAIRDVSIIRPFNAGYKLYQYNYNVLSLVNGFENLKDSPLNQVRYKQLNDILQFTLRETIKKSCAEDSSVIIKGNFVKLSDALKNIESTCSKPLKLIEIYTLDTIFIDQDVNYEGKNISLVIFSPKWYVTRRWSINLSGNDAVRHSVETVGSIGNNGDNGKPGREGGSSGHFFGFGKEFINGGSLSIFANGGNGARGQNGGIGVSGRDGESPTWDSLPPITNPYNTDFGVEKLETWSVGFVTTVTFLYYGKAGTVGGFGGKGGKGGLGGYQGNIKMLEMGSEKLYAHTSNRNGDTGGAGNGGEGGIGGKNGNNLEAIQTVVFPVPFWGPATERLVHTRALSGSNGQSNSFEEGRKSPNKIANIDYAKEINSYRIYLLNSINKNPLRDTKADLDFIHKMNNNTGIREIENTLVLYNEVLSIESGYYQFQNQFDIRAYYKFMLDRIEAYAKAPKQEEHSMEYKKALSHLYTGVLSKICKFSFSTDPDLITDISLYFDNVSNNIRNLEKSEKAVVVNNFKNEYKSDTEEKIEEARGLINSEVLVEIDILGQGLEEQIELLINETVEYQNAAVVQRDELLQTQRKMKQAVVLRKLFGVIKMFGQVASFLGPQGAAVGAVVNAGSSIAESIVLDDDIATGVGVHLPQGVNSLLTNVSMMINLDKDKRLAKLTEQIEDINKILGENPPDKLGDLNSKIKELENRLKIEKQNAGNGFDAHSTNAIFQIEKDLQTEINRKEKELKELAKKDQDAKTQRALKIVTQIQNGVKVAQIAYETYKKVKNDEAKIDAIGKQIREADAKIIQFTEYEDNIHSTLMPIIYQMQGQVNNVAEQLQNKSHVALDIAKWKVTTAIRDVKIQVQKFTNEFEVQESFLRIIEKLEEGMTILVNVYSRLENYEDQKKLADYLANINSAGSQQIVVSDPKLSEAIANVELATLSNILLGQYDKAMNAFKQWVFPFANYYLHQFNLPAHFDVGNAANSYDRLVAGSIGQIAKIKSELSFYNSGTVNGIDEYVLKSDFNSKKVSSQSFFVWENKDWKQSIQELLSGKEIFLKADVAKPIFGKNAIKFNLVEINIKPSGNETTQSEIDNVLNQFMITMVHQGSSYYRLADKYYLTLSNNQTIKYSHEKKFGKPVTSNQVYNKISKGDFMLSPYTYWTFKLEKAIPAANFADLQTFSNKVDLELVGKGIYLPDEVIDFSKLLPAKYYDEDNSVGIVNP